MRFLLIIVSILIAYGSLYPFDFQFPDAGRIEAITASRFDLFTTSRGDLLGNVGLFVPFGFVAILSTSHIVGRPARLAVVLIAGTMLAFFLQLAQLFVPARDPALVDVIWNLVGIFAGAAVGFVPAAQNLALSERTRLSLNVPLLLAGIWIVSQLMPLVPSLDLQLAKDSLKSLVLHPKLALGDALLHLAAWLVVFRFLSSTQSLGVAPNMLLGLPFLVLALQPFIVGNEVTLAEVLGAASASLAWLILRPGPRVETLALLLVGAILSTGLSTLDFQAPLNRFGWVPFSGFLEGGMLINAVALSRKLFLYGALIWLFRDMGMSGRRSTVYTVVFLAALEALQLFAGGAKPEVTDPILALLIAVAMRTVSRLRLAPDSRVSRGVIGPARGAQRPGSADRGSPGAGIEHLGTLDGLRGLAALAVFGVHFNQAALLKGQFGPFDLERFLSNGNTGVGLFFVLSGFLLSIPFWRAHDEPSRAVDTAAYALRRLARILPAYYACLFAIICAKAVSEGFPGSRNILAHVMFLHNLNERYIFSLNPVFWTLAVEMQFYLLLPVLFVALKPVPPRIAFGIVATACLGTYLANYELISSLIERARWPVDLALGGMLTVFISGPDSGALRYSTLGHLTFFLFGVSAAWVFLRTGGLIRNANVRPRFVFDGIFWMCALACILILATPLDDMLQLPFGHYNWPFAPVLLSVLVFAGPRARIARAVLDWGPVRWLGIVSYGVYIYHYPALKVTAKLMDKSGMSVVENWFVFGMLSLAATLLVAYASFALLEKPVVQAVRRWRELHRAVPAGQPPLTSPRWLEVPVGLSAEQIAYLTELAQQTGRSLSGATRQIITDCMRELTEAETAQRVQQYRRPDRRTRGEGASMPHDLPQVINLRAEHIQFLEGLSTRLGISVPQTVQVIVDECIRVQVDARL